MGICEVLTIVFVVAKLMGYISWSWGQVFIPMYIAITIYVGILLFGLGILGAMGKK